MTKGGTKSKAKTCKPRKTARCEKCEKCKDCKVCESCENCENCPCVNECKKCKDCECKNNCPNCPVDGCDYLSFRTICATVLCTLGAILLGLVLVYVGLSAAGTQVRVVTASRGEAAIIPVAYDQIKLDYEIDLSQIDKDDKRALAFKDLSLDKVSDNYTVISSHTQLEELLANVKLKDAEAANPALALDTDYFRTGTILAIAIEDEGVTDASINNITRDEFYDLSVDVAVKRAEEKEGAKTRKAKLFLFKIQNLNPQEVTVNLVEADAE